MDDPLGVHVGMTGKGEDDELAQIRARRMAELRAKGGDGQGGGFFGGLPPGMMGGGGQNPQTAEEQAERQRKADEQRAAILKSILTASARERCLVIPDSTVSSVSNIAMVKKDKARRIEDMLIQQARNGALGGPVEEDQLIQMLESISEIEGKSKVGKVTMQRRRMDDDW